MQRVIELLTPHAPTHQIRSHTHEDNDNFLAPDVTRGEKAACAHMQGVAQATTRGGSKSNRQLMPPLRRTPPRPRLRLWLRLRLRLRDVASGGEGLG